MRSFKPHPNERDSVKQTRERRKKQCNFDQQIPMKILSHYPLVLPSKKKFTILELFAKPFPTERKPSKRQTKEKKDVERKAKKRGGEKAKGKRRGGSKTFSKKKQSRNFAFCACPNFESCINLASGSKLVWCSTCKQRFGQFRFFLARERPKNGLTRFKRHFWQNFQGSMG